MKICITGSLGLIGSAVALHFLGKNHRVVGIDNNMREFFFGKEGSTKEQLRILSKVEDYQHHLMDVRDKKGIDRLFKKNTFNAVIHAAGQPSHDKAMEIPIIDFETNALGTLNVLEAVKKYAPKAVFIYTSTNKVYGDNPNKVKLKELKTRYDFKDSNFKGFDEACNIDCCTHSLMGSSKLAGDIYVQEYGKNFDMKTTSFRLGCVTGKAHAGVKLHGFLSYLVKSLVHRNSYEIIGYKGKQVRDQIHAEDVAAACGEIIKRPPKGEVFNLGGGGKNSASILELIEIISKKLNTKPKITYAKKPRTGDHICYITNFSKFRKHYSNWRIKRSLDSIIDELIKHEEQILANP